MRYLLWGLISLFMYSISIADTTEKIKIAVITAQTGDAVTSSNTESLGTARKMIAEFNQQGGILGHQIELIALDNGSSPLGSKIAARKAIKANVHAVIGAIWSSHSLAAASLLQPAKIPMISPLSTNPRVTQTGDYIFRACFIDPFQGKVMAHFAYHDLQARNAVILTNINRDYSIGLSQFFKNTFTELGGKVLLHGEYQGKSIEFTKLLRDLKHLNPDIVYLPGGDTDSSLIIRQAKKMGIKTTYLGGDSWSIDIFKYGKNELEGSYQTTHWHEDTPIKESKTLLKKLYGDTANIQVNVNDTIPLTYDSIMLLKQAIIRAGSLDRQKIRDALAATQNYEGATGTISFDNNGDPVNKSAVILYLDSTTKHFKKNVSPE